MLETYEHGCDSSQIIQLPSGEIVAGLQLNRTNVIQIRNPYTGVIIRNLTGHLYKAGTFAYLPKYGILASGSMDYEIKLWNITNGLLINSLAAHTGYISLIIYLDLPEKTLII